MKDRLAFAALAIAWTLARPAASCADTVVFHEPFRGERTIEGNLIAEGDDGELLFETPDGRHWSVKKPFLRRWDRSDEPLALLDRRGLTASLRREYGGAFRILDTKNYILVYSTSEGFAKEAGKLFERIKSVFENYIRKQAGFEPAAPKQPMIAVIFQSDEEYIRCLKDQIGVAAFLTAGVYIPATNRMFMYDMFGGRDEEWVQVATLITGKGADELALLLATENVSTLIHEGTHQVAFNTGFHERTVRNPLWLVEGLACLMEVPKLDSKSRWAGVGEMNWDRQEHLRENWMRLPTESVYDLVTDDGRLRRSDSALLGYAQAWALSYYLTKARRIEYMKFVELVKTRPPVKEYRLEDRLEDFRAAFGQTPEQMEPQFRRYVERTIFKRTRPRN